MRELGRSTTQPKLRYPKPNGDLMRWEFLHVFLLRWMPRSDAPTPMTDAGRKYLYVFWWQ